MAMTSRSPHQPPPPGAAPDAAPTPAAEPDAARASNLPPPPATPPPTSPPPGPRPADRVRARAGRLGFKRRSDGRVIAGVAAGLGARLGVDPVLVRIAFAVLVFAGGAGLLLYGLLWAFIPVEESTDPVRPRRPVTGQQGVALALIVLGILLALRAVGLWFGDALVGPIVLAAAGSAVLWARSDADTRSAWNRLTGRIPDDAVARAAAGPVSPVRVLAGTLLVAAALAGFVAANDALGAVQDLVLVIITAVAGIGLLFGPWLWRLLEQLSSERRERIRQEERAELAAHLHDSVLQTLALIQRSSDQPRRMVALARRQERELRTWLYGGSPTPGPVTTLETAVAELAEEIEDVHAVTVEVVSVGEVPLTEPVRALLGATREAVVNAAKHAGTDLIDVYVEPEDDEILAFVRDRGVGFDPAEVADDRQGIRRSIIERLERHGGRAVVRSRPGEGTEVELAVPHRPRRHPDPPEHPDAPTAARPPQEPS